jgi:hypothetical protein
MDLIEAPLHLGGAFGPAVGMGGGRIGPLPSRRSRPLRCAWQMVAES